MPKLTQVDTARHLGISCQTLYDWMQKGKRSVDADGFIDSSEVARVSGSVSKPDDSPEQELTTAVDATRELIEVLKAQVEEGRARERFLQEQVDRLTALID